jgi:hypothetical protein
MSRFTTTAPTRASTARRARCRRGVNQGALSAPAVLIHAALAGCAAYGPAALPVGASESAILAQMGAPTGRYALPDGRQRVEYARGPYGKHTYMLTLDASGRLQGTEQVLTEQRFSTIAPGLPMSEVRTTLGRPSESRVGWRGVGEVWSYRYDATFCQWFQVWGVNGVVREAAYAPDPLCDVDRDDRADR